jgi:hypothetical protein
LAPDPSEPKGDPTPGSITATTADLLQAHRLHGDELAGHERARALLWTDEHITVLCTRSSREGSEHTVLRRLAPDGKLMWDHAYEHHRCAGRAVARLPDGGIVIAGEAQRGPLAYAGALMFLDAAGDVLAADDIGATGKDGLEAIVALADGSTVAGGVAGDKGWIVRGDGAPPGGWQMTLDGVAEVVDVAALGGTGFALAAMREISTTALGMTQIVAMSLDRQELWSRRLPSSGRGEPAAMVGVDDGAVVVAGHWAPDGDAPAQLWAVRLDEAGWPVWEQRLGAEGEDRRARAIAALPGGGVAVAGDALHAGRRGLRVARLAGDGTPVWERRFEGAGDGHDVAGGLAATNDGGLVLASSTTDARAGTTHVSICRLDGAGELLWTHAFGLTG